MEVAQEEVRKVEWCNVSRFFLCSSCFPLSSVSFRFLSLPSLVFCVIFLPFSFSDFPFSSLSFSLPLIAFHFLSFPSVFFLLHSVFFTFIPFSFFCIPFSSLSFRSPSLVFLFLRFYPVSLCFIFCVCKNNLLIVTVYMSKSSIHTVNIVEEFRILLHL